jgi:hypothetical protein
MTDILRIPRVYGAWITFWIGWIQLAAIEYMENNNIICT